ncbi:MAG: hypothetical protein ABSG72_10815 [Candidatus Sulfotelmatobacter sp.]|jgi:hypothetical protein
MIYLLDGNALVALGFVNYEFHGRGFLESVHKGTKSLRLMLGRLGTKTTD